MLKGQEIEFKKDQKRNVSNMVERLVSGVTQKTTNEMVEQFKELDSKAFIPLRARI